MSGGGTAGGPGGRCIARTIEKKCISSVKVTWLKPAWREGKPAASIARVTGDISITIDVCAAVAIATASMHRGCAIRERSDGGGASPTPSSTASISSDAALAAGG